MNHATPRSDIIQVHSMAIIAQKPQQFDSLNEKIQSTEKLMRVILIELYVDSQNLVIF